MHRLRSSVVLVCAFVSFSCGDDGGAVDSSSTSSDDSASDDPSNDDSTGVSMTETLTTTTASESSTADQSTTMDPDSSTSTASTESSTSTTGSSSSDSGASSSDSGGEPAGYGNCLDFPEKEVCLAEESCQAFGTAAAACVQFDCVDPADCPVAASGDAEPACFDPGGGVFCGLDCSTGAQCPDGMSCFLGMWCAFAIEPAGGGVCPDDVLDATLPVSFDGDTTGLFDDVVTTIVGSTDSEDQLLQFTAPETQLYGVDISSFDIEPWMMALDGCGGDVFAETTLDASHMTLSLDAGQTIILAIEALDGSAGTYTLQIDALGPQLGGAECCALQPGTTGCTVQEIEDCVCADPFCCDTLWDGFCGLRAGECGADCI